MLKEKYIVQLFYYEKNRVIIEHSYLWDLKNNNWLAVFKNTFDEFVKRIDLYKNEKA